MIGFYTLVMIKFNIYEPTVRSNGILAETMRARLYGNNLSVGYRGKDQA